MKNYLGRVADLNTRYNLGFSPPELKKVVARLEVTKADFQDEQDWVAALESIGTHFKYNPLASEIQKQTLAINQTCPICNKPCQKVLLMEDRPAYFCKAHRVVLPSIVTE